MKTIAEKIATQAIRVSNLDPEADYLELINTLKDKEALAVAITKLDQLVTTEGFDGWRTHGYSTSRKAARLMNRLLPRMKSKEAKEVLALKQNYLYSVCEKQNDISTSGYKAIRSKFLNQVDHFLQKLA